MSFAKHDRKPLRPSVTRRPFAPARVPPGAAMRIVLLALLGAVAAAWALWHHYATRLPPLTRPAPSAAPTYDLDAGEIPVPSIEPAP